MIYSEERAGRIVDFFRLNLTHSVGQWAKRPFILLPWQEKILRDVFGTLNDDGTRQYREVYIEVPKKNGKSTLAAGVALYMLLADGEAGAEVYSAANAIHQSKIVFNQATAMVLQNRVLYDACTIYASVSEIRRKKGGYYKALSKDAKAFHGLNPSCIIFDELHALPNRELWDTLTSSSMTARRQPLIFTITTAGYNRNSLCGEKHKYAEQVKEGIIDDPTFYPVIYSAEEKDDWTSPEVWKKTNPSFSLFKEEDVKADCEEAQQSATLENNFRRFRLCQWVQQAVRYIPTEEWDKEKERKEIGECEVFYGGLDLSSTQDLTALVLASKDEEGLIHVFPHFWVPEDIVEERSRRDHVNYVDWVAQGYIKTTTGKAVDYGEVYKTIADLLAKHDIQYIAYDPSNATALVEDLNLIFTDRMIPVRQCFGNLTAPTKQLLMHVLNHKIRHAGHPVLRWNIDNLTVREGPSANVMPSKERGLEKIDGAVALIMAIDMIDRFSESARPLKDWSGELITI